MALNGETIGENKTICMDCGKELKLQVCFSTAFYLGFWCNCCGPYSRESGYFSTEGEALDALDSGVYGR